MNINLANYATLRNTSAGQDFNHVSVWSDFGFTLLNLNLKDNVTCG
jgi:hypothetical protein